MLATRWRPRAVPRRRGGRDRPRRRPPRGRRYRRSTLSDAAESVGKHLVGFGGGTPRGRRSQTDEAEFPPRRTCHRGRERRRQLLDNGVDTEMPPVGLGPQPGHALLREFQRHRHDEEPTLAHVHPACQVAAGVSLGTVGGCPSSSERGGTCGRRASGGPGAPTARRGCTPGWASGTVRSVRLGGLHLSTLSASTSLWISSTCHISAIFPSLTVKISIPAIS